MSYITFNISGSGQQLNTSNTNEVKALQLLLNAALHYEQPAYDGTEITYIDDLETDGIYGTLTNNLRIILLGNVPLYKNQLMALAAALPATVLDYSDYSFIAQYLGVYNAPPATGTKTTTSQAPATDQQPAGSFNLEKFAPLFLIGTAIALFMLTKKR